MKTNKISFLATLLVILASCSEKMDSNPEIPEITGLTEDVHFEQVGQIQTMGLVEHYEHLLNLDLYNSYKQLQVFLDAT